MDLVETLTQNMSGFSSETLIWINGIVSNATRAVGLYLVGILIVLEIAKMFERANASNAGIVTLKMFQGLAFRVSLGGITVAFSSFILNFLLIIGIGLANLISRYAGDAFSVFTLPSVQVPTDTLSIIGEMLSALLNPTEAVRRGILVLILIVVGALITLAAYVMVWVIIVLRFFQLYVMLAMMPIPMASFASEEHDHIGKNYIKRVLAYSFQPAVIMVVFGVYHFLSSITLNLTGLGNPLNIDMEVQFFQNLILAIVFIIVLWQTHRKSSELFGL
ncbi:type IV secretion system protein [Enterococcus gallinarum]|uniref:type IV secretion system protein n=1 Tax=Enterococcus gallinarum TaxID=1353 RepID=UPI0018AB754E|nr:type IV secretion system protein [Enterococcus gallinarum]